MKQNKLDRRAAIGLLGIAAGIIASDTLVVGAGQGQGKPLPKVKALVDMDRFEGFIVQYKGKTKEYTTDEVMDALFGAGSFGNEEVIFQETKNNYEYKMSRRKL